MEKEKRLGIILIFILVPFLLINIVAANTNILLPGNFSEIGYVKNSSSVYTFLNYSEIIIGCNGACSSWISRGVAFFNVVGIDPQISIDNATLILNINYTNITTDNIYIYDVDELNWTSVSNSTRFFDLGNGNNYSSDIIWGQTAGNHSILLNTQLKNEVISSINNGSRFGIGFKESSETFNSRYLNISKESVILNLTYHSIKPPLTTAIGNYSDNGEKYFLGSIGNRSVNITFSCAYYPESTSCINTTYCNDTANTCTPSILYTSPIRISFEGISYIRFKSLDNQGYQENIESEVINLNLNQPVPSPIVWSQCNPADLCCDQKGYFRSSGFVCRNAHNAVCDNSITCSGHAFEDRCTGASSSCPDNNYNITYNDACNEAVCTNQSCSGYTFQPQRTCNTGICQTNNAYQCPNNLICKDTLSCKASANSSSDCKSGYLFDNSSKVCYLENNYTYDLVYDANGNLISIFNNKAGLGWQYSYNDFNQLFQVKDEGVFVLVENYYDESGNRIKRVEYDGLQNTTTFYFDNFIQTINDSGVFNETYYYFYNILVGKKENNGEVLFYHPNRLGSNSLITNLSGGIVEDIQYEPYGKNNQTTQRYAYTGHENEPTDSLLYMGARYYNPELGKFIQPDPIIGDIYDPQVLNKYSYVRNNPYRYTDPNGEFLHILAGGAIGGILGGAIDWAVQAYNKGIGHVNYKEVVKASVVGAAAGATFAATFGLGTAAIGAVGLTGTSATIATGGVVAGSGAISGQASIMTNNALEGNSITVGLGNKQDLLRDAGLAVVTWGAFEGANSIGKSEITNPYGKIGGPTHQRTIQEIKLSLESQKLNWQTEFSIRDSRGNIVRYVDIASLDNKGNPLEFYQVGKSTKSGLPVSREREAITDISKITGKGVYFIPYN